MGRKKKKPAPRVWCLAEPNDYLLPDPVFETALDNPEEAIRRAILRSRGGRTFGGQHRGGR